MPNVTKDTLDLVKIARSAPDEALAKSFTQSTGLVAYDLQAPALSLFPVITPLRNMIPRVKANGGTATNWKAVTGIDVNGTKAGVSEGNRGAIMTTAVQTYTAAYKGIGLEDNVSWEADYASEGFDDVKAIATRNLLSALMIAEEKMILGGNSGVINPLGITPTPALISSGSGSGLSAAAYTVQCIALTRGAFSNGSVPGGIPAQVTKTNADGSTDTVGGGSAQISATAAITPSAGNNIIATVAPVKGACGYAWYWGLGGAPVLGAITSISQVTISGAAAGTQTAASMPASDNSGDALAFDGLISQICAPNSGAYYNALAAGQTLTSNGAAGVVEIDVALQAFWDNYRLSPDMILVNSQELKNITAKMVSGGGTPLFRFNENGGGATVTGGNVIGSYLNKFTMDGGAMIDIKLHPNVTPGTMILMSRRIPYPLSNVGNVLQIKTRRDYYQLEWPWRTRRFEFGVYADEVLQNYFPPAFGMITNIANG